MIKLWYETVVFQSNIWFEDGRFGHLWAMPGAKDFDYTEHSFAVSEWSVSPADTTIKVWNGSGLEDDPEKISGI